MMGVTLPHSRLRNPNNDEKDRFGESIDQQLPLPPQSIKEGRCRAQFWVCVPLTEVGACATTLSPGAVDDLLVPPTRSVESKGTAPITQHRRGDDIDDDVISS